MRFDSYILCGTPRSGSTLLCALLAATPGGGRPDSFFMRPLDPVWRREWRLPLPEDFDAAGYAAAYLAAARQAGTAGLFGLRLMQETLADLRAMLELDLPGLASDRARIGAAFGRVLYLHLSRADKLAQAVSLVKAAQTGLWHIAPDGRALEQLGAPRPPRYDFARIGAVLADLQQADAAWAAWFAAEGIVPLRIGYEALAADPAGVLGQVCGRLGLAAPAVVRPDVAKMADAVSAEWTLRYRRDAVRL